MHSISSTEADELFSVLNNAEPEFVLARLNFLWSARVSDIPDTPFEYETDHNHAWYLMGLSNEKLGDLEKATACFEVAIELCEDDIASYLAVSNVSSDLPKIIRILERGLKLTGDDRIRFNLANTYIDNGNSKRAKELLKEISPEVNFIDKVNESLREIK